jgi:hypothetical protein
MWQVYIIVLPAVWTGCGPHPSAIRTVQPVDLDGIRPLPSFGIACEGYDILPLLAVNVEVLLPGNIANEENIAFQLRDAKTHVVKLRTDLEPSKFVAQVDEEGKRRLAVNDVFRAPRVGRHNANELPLGCYYVEAIAITKSGEAIIARSKLVTIGR